MAPAVVGVVDSLSAQEGVAMSAIMGWVILIVALVIIWEASRD